jgi:hypothetical protein
MIESLENLRKELESLKRQFQRVKAQHVNRSSDKEAIRELVRRYFDDYRPKVAAEVVSEERLKLLDGAMQDLLKCAQGRTPTKACVARVRTCEKELNSIEIGALPRGGRTGASEFDRRECLILETLKKVDVSAASCFEQGLMDLAQPDRKSWSGTILEFREALRKTLDRLAPDEEVMKSSGFRLEPYAKGPTMKQKTMFILRSRGLAKSQAEPAKEATGWVEEYVGRIVRTVYEKASTGVHTEVTRAEAFGLKNWVVTALAELLEIQG